MKTIRKLQKLLLVSSATLTIIFGCTPSSNETAEEPDLQVGVAYVNISGEDANVLDPLQVKAIVFQQGAESGAIVECDVSTVYREVTSPAREEASEKTGIPYENICVAATHTHMDDPHTDLVPAIVEAVEKASSSLQPVELKSGVGQEFTVAYNRRYYMRDGSVAFNPMFLNPDIVRPVGPIDAQVGFVLMTNTESKKPLYSITNYALHLDIVKQYGAVYQKSGAGSPNSVSADYPYWIEESLQSEFGESFRSIFLTGCCGNINHWDFSKPGPQSGYMKSKQVGDSIATAIKRILPVLERETPVLAIRSESVEVPLQTFSEQDLAWAKSLNQANLSGMSEEISERQQFLNRVKMNRIFWLNEQKQNGIESVPIDVQVFRLTNHTAVVTFPGEMFVEFGLMVKNFSPFRNTLVMELSNDSYHYVPNRIAFSEGGYEVENSRIAPGGGEMLADAAIDMLHDLKH